MNLNEQQLKAINSNSPTILAIAGPGAGKSATLVARVQRLIRDGTDPAAICVITFTRSAAAELQERLGDVRLGFNGNLHSLMFRLLQQHGHLIGLPQQLTILDAETAAELLAECAVKLKSKASEKALTELRETWPQWSPGCSTWNIDRLVVKEYYSRMRDSGAVDFDSILHTGLQVIKAITATDGFVGWPFKFLFVDEFQDSSDTDYTIYRAMPMANKFYVGDPDQSIFGFRGGNVGNILDLSEFESTDVILLEKNYRSRLEICYAANRLIAHNTCRAEKQIVATRDGGSIGYRAFEMPAMELEFICQLIREFYPATAAGTAAEVAVLWRSNRLVDECTEYLKAHGIAVVERRRVPVAATATARAALAVMMNPYNEMAVQRYITLIDSKAAATKANRDATIRMENLAHLYFKGVSDVLVTPDKGEHFLSEIVGRFSDQIKVPQEARDSITAAAAKLTGTFTLADLMFALDEQTEADAGNGVAVKTFHSAKGLQFPFVIVGGMEQETCPGTRKDADIPESRRLFFVAITRAMDRLMITRCHQRQCAFKAWVMEPKTASQFVSECLEL